MLGIPFLVQVWISTLSYPAPLWQIYFNDAGSTDRSSASKGPVNYLELVFYFSFLPFSLGHRENSPGSKSLIDRAQPHRYTRRFCSYGWSLLGSPRGIPVISDVRPAITNWRPDRWLPWGSEEKTDCPIPGGHGWWDRLAEQQPWCCLCDVTWGRQKEKKRRKRREKRRNQEDIRTGTAMMANVQFYFRSKYHNPGDAYSTTTPL